MDTGAPCIVDIVRLSNWNNQGQKKKIYISGGINGDEALGPVVSVYFMEYLISSAINGDPLAKKRFNKMLDNLEIIITPMTNSVGYIRQ